MEAGGLSRILAAYKRNVPFIKEQVDAVLEALGAKPGDLAAAQSTLGRTAIRQIETLYIASLMKEWVDELVEAVKGGDSEYFREPAHHHRRGHGLLGGPARRPLPQREGGRRQDRGLPDHHPVHVEPGSASTTNGEHGPLEEALDRRAGGRHREAHQRPAHGALLRPLHRLRRACHRAGYGQALRDRHEPLGGEVTWPISHTTEKPILLPFVITHWINLVAMILLILIGLHHPLPGAGRSSRASPAAAIVFFGFVLFINCVGPRHHGLLREDRADRRHPPAGDRLQDLAAAEGQPSSGPASGSSYYLFLKKDHPLGAKLGVPQKISYLLIPILIVADVLDGPLPVGRDHERARVRRDGTNLVGGLMSMRIIHYFGMYVFIIFMFIHIYLANVEGFAPTKLMFIRKEHGGLVYDPDLHNIVGEDADLH